jgi:phage-related protein (TIGR01555 family)
MAARKTLKALDAPAQAEKPRIRVKAWSAVNGNGITADSFQNFAASLGLGTNNLTSQSTYGFNPISRNHTQLEWMYRGSWLVMRIVDLVAEDMTRAGVEYNSILPPDELDELEKYINDLALWQQICLGIKWSRLYGGAGCYIDINGQRPDTPLRIETIGKGQFRGLIPLDRWVVWPHLEELVQEPGPDFGKPKYYSIVADGLALPRMKFHYSRFVRFEGISLPYWQAMQENQWGMSVIEPIYDRLVAFDSATTGAAQLIYKAHLRTYSVEGLRELIASGGKIYDAFLQSVGIMRAFQSNEGITLLDATDKFETHQYAFTGLSDMLIQFAQQLSGGAAIPVTRLYGQAPAGLNATGDSDTRNYFDMINSRQNAVLRAPWGRIIECAYRSLTGKSLPPGFTYKFRSLWQMTDLEKAQIGSQKTNAIVAAKDAGLLSDRGAMKELRQMSSETGMYSNITDEDIENASDEPPPPPDLSGSLGVNQQQDPQATAALDPENKPVSIGGA